MMEAVSAYEIAVHKTASYTTVGPLAAGAALAGVRDSDIDALARNASPLGVAFQFRDDLLSTFGDPAKIGKSTDSDLLEGKRTVLVEEARARSDKLQWKRIEKVLGKKQATAEDVSAAREALIKCGAKAACEAHIAELTGEFILGMNKNYFGDEAKQFLIQLASYLGSRDL
jgi:geranylgeranyl diphosphate synthase type I